MKKKKYVAPEISVIGMEPLQIMTGSIGSDHGSTPDGDKTMDSLAGLLMVTKTMDSAFRKKRKMESMNSKFYIDNTL